MALTRFPIRIAPFELCALVMPILAVHVPLGLAPLFGIMALIVAWTHRRDWRGAALGEMWPPGAVLLAFALLAVASVAWSVSPATSIDRLPRVLATLAAGFVLCAAARGDGPDSSERTGRMLLAGLGLAVALLLLDKALGSPLMRALHEPPADHKALLDDYNNGVAVLTVLVWPAMLFLAPHRKAPAVLLFAAALAIAGASQIAAASLALLLGAAIAVPVWIAPKWSIRTLALALPLLILLAPPLIGGMSQKVLSVAAGSGAYDTETAAIPESGYHRFFIWRFVIEKIAERPIAGWGFNTSRAIPGGHRNVTGGEALPLHPHNGMLQLWLELGFAGALLAAVLSAVIIVRIGHLKYRVQRAAGVGFMVTVLTIASLSYGLWQSWWMATLFLATALFLRIKGSLSEPAGRRSG